MIGAACKLTELPHNIKHLSGLLRLDARNCKSLQSLPELPTSIRDLHAHDCTSLKTLQLTSHIEASVSCLRNLSDLILIGCEQLYELPESVGSSDRACHSSAAVYAHYSSDDDRPGETSPQPVPC